MKYVDSNTNQYTDSGEKSVALNVESHNMTTSKIEVGNDYISEEPEPFK